MTSTRKTTRARLDTGDWIKAGLGVLATSGVDAVRIEPLARSLGVTKGSFYWHFAGRDDLLERMLQAWRRSATLAVIDRIEASHESPRERLMDLLDLPFGRPRSTEGARIELAIRIWGQTDPHVAEMLREVDAIRLSYIARLFTVAGYDAETARARAVLAYSYLRVAPSLAGEDELATLRANCAAVLLCAPGGEG